MITLGQKIKQLRLAKEMSQPQLSQTMGIEQSYLSKLENDKAFPSDEMFMVLIETLEVSLEIFIQDFEATYINSHLSKIALIKQLSQQNEKRSLSFMMRWILISSLLVILGGTVLLSGIYGWFVKPIHITSNFYESHGLIKHDESLRLFKEHFLTAFPEHLMLRLDRKQLAMEQDSGSYFVKEEQGGRRLYSRMRRQDNRMDNTTNHWMAALGLFALLSGVVGLIVEHKVRSLHRLSR